MQYIQIGNAFGGTFPVIDLANLNTVVSLKTINIFSKTRTFLDDNGKINVNIKEVANTLEKYYHDIDNVKITVNGKEVEKILYIEMNNGKNIKLREDIMKELDTRINNKSNEDISENLNENVKSKCKIVM